MSRLAVSKMPWLATAVEPQTIAAGGVRRAAKAPSFTHPLTRMVLTSTGGFVWTVGNGAMLRTLTVALSQWGSETCDVFDLPSLLA